VLAETISKEPLGPFTRNGDAGWSRIIEWLHMALIEAEELGVTQANAADRTKDANPTVQRLLGTAGEFGAKLGLENGWALAALRAVGNYGEIFERNVGGNSPLKLPRRLTGIFRDK
jgi:general L-amino acid transport system substrate-binding protein